MLRKASLILVAAVIASVTSFSIPALAEQNVLYGVFSNYRNSVLTVLAQDGSKSSFDITRETKVMSWNGETRLERFRPGSRMSVTSKNGVAISVVVKEVPK